MYTADWFAGQVAQSWSLAVMESAHRFSEVRPALMDALNSEDSEVRSAAIAVFNDANDASAHDAVIALADDPDERVRDEVLEYIEQFPLPSDARYLLSQLEAGRQVYLASSGLRRLCGDRGELVTDDDLSELADKVSAWRSLLRQLKYSF